MQYVQKKVLKNYDPHTELVLQTDASGIGVGAAIMQYDANRILQPIAYQNFKQSGTKLSTN